VRAFFHSLEYIINLSSANTLPSNADNLPRSPVMASSTNQEPQPPSSHIYEVYSPVLHATTTDTENDSESLAFHRFPDLPTELRDSIWAFALLNETTFHETRYWIRYADIDIHLEADDIVIIPRRKYPTLFFVNREVRAAAARTDGGKWYLLGIDNTSVYANVDKDAIWVHDCCAGFLDFGVLPRLAQFELDAGELYVGLECTEEE
jgi:hypothetical protein